MSLVNNKGFTLIELLVVVLIIGILAAIALPQYQLVAEKARSAEALTILGKVKRSAEGYRAFKGAYPDDLTKISIGLPQSKLWDYSVSPQEVTATRKGGSAGFSKSYQIAFRYDGQGIARIVCRSTDDQDYAEKICKALGATTTDGGAFPNQNWIL